MITEKLCECCGKRPIPANNKKYCEVCGPHHNAIARYQKQGKDLSQVDFTVVKMCEYCGQRPVGKGSSKYCKECGKYSRQIAYNRKLGIEEIEDFSKPKLCRHCGKPVAKGKKVYCETCFKHKNTIETALYRGYTGKFWFDGKLCECCGKRLIEKGMTHYCRTCFKKYTNMERLKRSDKRRQKAGERLSNCTYCNQRERLPGRNVCEICFKAIRHAKYTGTYSYRDIAKPHICECCGNRPVGKHKNTTAIYAVSIISKYLACEKEVKIRVSFGLLETSYVSGVERIKYQATGAMNIVMNANGSLIILMRCVWAKP